MDVFRGYNHNIHNANSGHCLIATNYLLSCEKLIIGFKIARHKVETKFSMNGGYFLTNIVKTLSFNRENN